MDEWNVVTYVEMPQKEPGALVSSVALFLVSVPLLFCLPPQTTPKRGLHHLFMMPCILAQVFWQVAPHANFPGEITQPALSKP